MSNTTLTTVFCDLEAEPENAYSDFSNIGRKLHNTAGCIASVTYTGESYSKSIGLTWNSQYQLTEVTTNGTAVERNGFDALGRRVWNWDGSTTNYMVYDGVHVLAEVDSTGGLRRAYTHGPGIDNWLAMTVYTGATAKTYFYLTDHQGTVHAVADETGTIVESYRFDSWGRVFGVYNGNGTPLTESAIGNRILWQGREYSWKTGLYFFRARWYEPVTGRWLSNDPIGINGGLNQYVFCSDNPLNSKDPLGLDSNTTGQAMTQGPSITDIKLNVTGTTSSPLTATLTYKVNGDVKNIQTFFWTCTWQGIANRIATGNKFIQTAPAWKKGNCDDSIQYNSGFPPNSVIIFYAKITGDVTENGQVVTKTWYPDQSITAQRVSTSFNLLWLFPIDTGEKVIFAPTEPPAGIK